MGRRKRIDPERLVDLAEEIVRSRGAAALTVDALAKAAGITKGGVQYSFASKDLLIDAIVARWNSRYDAAYARHAGVAPDAAGEVRAHVAAMQESEELRNGRAAGVMLHFLQRPGNPEASRDWYRERLDGFGQAGAPGRLARLAFLAAEGAFLLRILGLAEFDEAEWEAIVADITGLAEGRAAAP